MLTNRYTELNSRHLGNLTKDWFLAWKISIQLNHSVCSDLLVVNSQCLVINFIRGIINNIDRTSQEVVHFYTDINNGLSLIAMALPSESQ